MKEELYKTHPYIMSICIALLMTFIIVVGNVISIITKMNLYLNGAGYYLILSIANIINILIAILLMKKSDYSFKEYGFQKIKKTDISAAWFLIPLVIEVVLPVICAGFNNELSVVYYLITLLFTVTVGFTEEMFFRGLILKYISIKGVRKAIIWSAIIFGIVHLSTALRGDNISVVIIRIIFAVLFGIVCAELVFLTKSIWIPIIWHAIHDFISYTTNATFTIGSLSTSTSVLIIELLQFFVLLVVAVGIWNKCSFGNNK